MKTIITAAFLTLATVVASPALLSASATIAHADEPRFDFSSRKTADESYARVFAQFSPAGRRAFLRDVKTLVIIQFSSDGTVSGGRAAIERRKPTSQQYFAAMARALDGKTAADVVTLADRLGH